MKYLTIICYQIYVMKSSVMLEFIGLALDIRPILSHYLILQQKFSGPFCVLFFLETADADVPPLMIDSLFDIKFVHC